MGDLHFYACVIIYLYLFFYAQRGKRKIRGRHGLLRIRKRPLKEYSTYMNVHISLYFVLKMH